MRITPAPSVHAARALRNSRTTRQTSRPLMRPTVCVFDLSIPFRARLPRNSRHRAASNDEFSTNTSRNGQSPISTTPRFARLPFSATNNPTTTVRVVTISLRTRPAAFRLQGTCGGTHVQKSRHRHFKNVTKNPCRRSPPRIDAVTAIASSIEHFSKACVILIQAQQQLNVAKTASRPSRKTLANR